MELCIKSRRTPVRNKTKLTLKMTVVKSAFANAVKQGKTWPALLIVGAVAIAAAALIAGGVYVFLNYYHVFSVRTENDVFFGTQEYMRKLLYFRDNGHLTQAQYTHFRDNLTPYMASRFNGFGSLDHPDLDALYSAYHHDGGAEKAALATQIMTRTTELLASNIPIPYMVERYGDGLFGIQSI